MCKIRSEDIAAGPVEPHGLLHLFRQPANDLFDRLLSRSVRFLDVPRNGLGESGWITISPGVLGQVVEPINQCRLGVAQK